MRTRFVAILLLLTATLASCFGSDSGGGTPTTVMIEDEPNDELIQATDIKLGRPIQGDVVEAEDEDWFRLKLKDGKSVKVELFATRLDQATWDAALTVPRLTVYFPDDETKLHEHSFQAGWTFGSLDFEIPAFTVPQTGFYWFVIRADTDLSPGGRYVLRVSYVTPAPGHDEIEEPIELGVNDTPGTGQVLNNGTLVGFHREGNDDFFKVQVGGSRVIRAELIGHRNGALGEATSPYDPLMRLLDVDGATILAENDDAFFADPGIQHHVVAAGTYFLQVTQGPASTEDGSYVLDFSADTMTVAPESEPNDTSATADALAFGGAVSGGIVPGQEDWFRFVGDAGDMIRLQVFDATNSTEASETVDVALFAADGTTPVPFHSGGEFQVVRTILQQDGDYFARVVPGPTAVAGTLYRLELKRFHASTPEDEPNDALADADPFPGGKFAAGEISTPGDLDLFRFTTSRDQLVTFVVYAGNVATGSDGVPDYSGWGSALPPLLTVRDVVGAAVAVSTSTPVNGVFTESVIDGLPTAAVTFVAPPTSTTFYLEVTSADGSGAGGHTYVVERR